VKSDIQTFFQALEEAYPPDHFRLKRALQRIERLPLEHPRRIVDLERWVSTLTQSKKRRELRESLELAFEYDAELPITAHREELLRLLADRQALVVCGETGSGKSTQLPKICLEAGFGRRAMIGHTQPRRIAARSIAARLREELSNSPTPLPTVGFKIRFNDGTAPTTLVKLMTDGVLLAELSRDHYLDSYEVIIIDEAHERSLNIDLLMAHLHWLLPKRPELKLIITSATIDAERFSNHFCDALGPAPIVQVSGRTYPVDVRYLGNESMPTSADDRLRQAVDELLNEMRGDILAFFPTEREIRLAHKLIQGHLNGRGNGDRVEILPLYSRLTEAEQQKIFQPHKKRRIVLATNVAESSLTVPGIYSVIDTGTARISRYAPRSKVQRLPIEPISQASANQRAGRCGRLAPGICIRLYDESDYLSRSPFTTPEIRRTDLASAILHAELLKIGSIGELAFLDPPRPEMIRDGMATLQEIGAMDDSGAITGLGRQLGRWPVSPRVGRMIIEGHRQDCLADVLIIASALEAQDVRMRPIEKQGEADAAHQKFVDLRSDFVSILRVWDFYHRLKEDLGRSRLEKACRENYLSLPRLHEWMDLHRQLRELTIEAGFKIGPRRLESHLDPPKHDDPRPRGYDEVHQCLLVGLLSGIAYLDDAKKYKGAGNIELQLWPGSGLKGQKPKWIVASEVVETHMRFARTAAAIEPEWLERIAGHLLKRQHESPHFSRKMGAAMIYERATLFGLPVIARRPVPLASIDTPQARRLLIDEGLVEKQLTTQARFYQHNLKLLEEVQAWAAKTRRRELVVDPYFLQQFYEQNLPDDIVNRVTLEKFDRTLQNAAESKVHLTWQQLVDSFDREKAASEFPSQISIGPTQLPIEYRFAPGANDDGITVKVPEHAISQLTDEKLGWLVPGLLEEKVTQLIKTLPKHLRRNLVPAPAMASKAMPALIELRNQQAPFWSSLCQVLSRLGGERVSSTDFETDKVDAHLRIRLEIVDDKGEVKQTSREVQSLKPIASTSTAAIQVASKDLPPWFCENWKEYVVDALPKTLVVQQQGIRVERCVGLLDHGESVAPSLFDYPLQAEAASLLGLTRLYVLGDNRELRSHLQHLPGLAEAQLKLSDRIGTASLRDAIRDLIGRVAFFEGSHCVGQARMVWTKSDYESRRIDHIKRLSLAAVEVGAWLPKLAKAYHELRLSIPKNASSWQTNLDDVHQQLTSLFPVDFFMHTPWEWLREYPRYFDAIKHRLSRWKSGGIQQDLVQVNAIRSYVVELDRLLKSQPHHVWNASKDSKAVNLWPLGNLMQFRWMIEEFRVSCFAQQLGTRISISPKRLDKQRELCQ
jgi:ATP-dependent helicase HrpA